MVASDSLWLALAFAFRRRVGGGPRSFAFAFALGVVVVVVVVGFSLGTCVLDGCFVEAVVLLRVDDCGDLVGVVFVGVKTVHDVLLVADVVDQFVVLGPVVAASG